MTSSLILLTITGGVPAGAIKPTQKTKSEFATPLSTVVGIFGKAEERFAVLTAKAFNFPPCIKGRAVESGAKYQSALPPMTSDIASGVPL